VTRWHAPFPSLWGRHVAPSLAHGYAPFGLGSPRRAAAAAAVACTELPLSTAMLAPGREGSGSGRGEAVREARAPSESGGREWVGAGLERGGWWRAGRSSRGTGELGGLRLPRVLERGGCGAL
jgi:hypothetical protein